MDKTPIKHSITSEQVVELINELGKARAELFKITTDSSEDIKKVITIDVKEFIEDEWFESLYGSGDPQKSLEAMDRMIEALNSLDRVEVKISFVPTIENVSSIVSLLDEKIKTPVVIEIETDPSVIAGAVIEYDGKYGNFSVGKAVEETFK